MLKKLSIIGFILCLSGCVSQEFDPARYVELDLNSTYIGNHSEELLNMFEDEMTMDDLEEIHQENIKAEAEFFYYLVDSNQDLLNEETQERCELLFDEIYKHTRFEVKGAEETDTGYVVNLDIYPIDLIVNTINEERYQEIVDNVYSETELSEEELENNFMNSILDSLDNNIENLGYLDKVEIQFEMIEEDNTYNVSEDSWSMVDMAIIAY